jgi:hypothetical protein
MERTGAIAGDTCPCFVRRCQAVTVNDWGILVLYSRRLGLVTAMAAVVFAGCATTSDSGAEVSTSVTSTSIASETTTTDSLLASTTVTVTDTTTTTAAVVTTTTVPPTTTTTVYYVVTGTLYPPDAVDGTGASGSGCAPGSGSLPAGVWFGYASAGNATSVQFDLACWYFGDLAWEIADTYGETAENDYYIVNENPALRTVPVAPGAVVHHIDPMSIGHDLISYPDWLLEPPGYLMCPFEFCPLWLYVNDGVVTEILEQYVP